MATTSVADKESPTGKPIQDGRTLGGWHLNGEGDWTVEEKAFVGRSHNAQLCGPLVSEDKYQSFTARIPDSQDRATLTDHRHSTSYLTTCRSVPKATDDPATGKVGTHQG